jgi:serine phosphatase RsbU (regulator of sigma subunit)
MGMEIPFRSRSLILKPGDLLVLMSDGMGPFRSSSRLNRMFSPLVSEWQAQNIPPDEVPLLIASHLRYHVSDALDQTRDDATLVSLAITTEDLVQPLLPNDVLQRGKTERTPSLFDW